MCSVKDTPERLDIGYHGRTASNGHDLSRCPKNKRHETGQEREESMTRILGQNGCTRVCS
jgi:hypothetical protein